MITLCVAYFVLTVRAIFALFCVYFFSVYSVFLCAFFRSILSAVFFVCQTTCLVRAAVLYTFLTLLADCHVMYIVVCT